MHADDVPHVRAVVEAAQSNMDFERWKDGSSRMPWTGGVRPLAC
jgi:hypothetical protein